MLWFFDDDNRKYTFIEVAVFVGLNFWSLKNLSVLKRGKFYFVLLTETLHC